MQPRRTSRKPVQVGRWTPQARRAQRAHAALRRNATTRRGRLAYKHVHASEYKGSDPLFKGRIVVDRGAGIIEFPNPEQFQKIARQENVPPEEVDKAFGHLLPSKGAKRRTSRKPRRASRVQRNAGGRRRKQIGRDMVYVPTTIDGEEEPLRAVSSLLPAAQVGAFGADRAILATAAGQTVALRYDQAFHVLDRWLTKKEFQKAFGHLRTAAVLGATERRRPIPTHYGPRSMRLGHRSPPGEGPPRGGIVKGQLVLFHKPSGSIVWQIYDDETNFPDKPLWIWYGAHKIHVDFPKAMSGAKVGTGDRAHMVGAVDRGVPPMAMLQAFDHLLRPDQRAEAYRVFAGMR